LKFRLLVRPGGTVALNRTSSKAVGSVVPSQTTLVNDGQAPDMATSWRNNCPLMNKAAFERE
jgi:hypothetical protein